MDNRIEYEVLLDDIQQLERNKKVTTSPDLQAEIFRKVNISRGHNCSSLLSPEIKDAAKELKDNDAIYCWFSKTLVYGDYKIGYAYGNVKTNKQVFPLCHIISQIPSVTYKLAKRLNELIISYTPVSYSLKNSGEFLDHLRSTPSSGIIGSMDVASLFTYAHVDETIDMIWNRIYHDREAEDGPLVIPEHTLRCLLSACTKEAPFYGPDSNIYVQIDDVAIGSPLGVLLANFYMGTIERIFRHNPELLPSVYVRYIDDDFISAENENHILQISPQFMVHRFNYYHSVKKDECAIEEWGHTPSHY
ncbi:uncharacterized protein LOC143033159 [Oratosquilla oratoria]|uniref:uncharacterized protein LOC143033159 n=1 Tax=Oratosquilla oratoria TaxID=337810 RepID=UPI003F76503D